MQRIFEISLTLLIVLGGLILAVSEGGPVAAGTGPIALACLYFVDWKRAFSPPAYFAGILGSIAFVAAGVELVKGGIDAPLVAAGHLLVYLTWALLLNRKTETSCWLLLALSILQVALAVFLSSRVWVGVGLVGYTVLAIWTLSVFHLSQSIRSQKQSIGKSSAAHPANLPHRIRVRGGVSRKRHERLLSYSFIGSDLTLAGFSLLVGILFYLFIPRVWTSAAVPGERDSGQPLTGFTSMVRLGDIGEILESDASAMSVRLFDRQTRLPMPDDEAQSFLGAAPLFRGSTQERYSFGNWQRLGRNEQVTRNAIANNLGTVREEITLNDTTSVIAFTFGDVTAVALDSPGQVSRLENSDEFVYQARNQMLNNVRYSVYATRSPRDTEFRRFRDLAIENSEATADPSLRQLNLEPRFDLRLERYLNVVSRVPRNLNRLEELTKQIVGDETHPRQIAERIRSHLQDNGRFGYSLELLVEDPTIDPLEDFLFNRMEGHCEYFASAMTMMLRSAGVPARMIVGFKGGVYHPETHTFEIQELHAHTWVEAYLDGGWVTYDPTPAGRDESVQEQETTVSVTGQRLTAGYWNFIVRFSRYDQLQNIYHPIGDSFRFLWEMVRDLFRGNFAKLQTLGQNVLSPRSWFSWGGVLFVLGIVGVISGVVWLARRLSRAQRLIESLIRKMESGSSQAVPRVAFYERFVGILKEQGMTREPTQTPREFVHQSCNSLHARFQGNGWTAWTAQMADEFYRVRFGGEELSEPEIAEMNQRLDDLEALFRQPPVPGLS